MAEWEAGPALDTAVARLLGWMPPASEIVDAGGRPMYRNREPFDHICRGECFHRGHALAGHPSAPLRQRGTPLPPPYSTEISPAWAVLEHFQQQGRRVHVAWDTMGEQWIVSIEEPQTTGDPIWLLEAGCTAPLAICRAALEAAADAPGER